MKNKLGILTILLLLVSVVVMQVYAAGTTTDPKYLPHWAPEYNRSTCDVKVNPFSDRTVSGGIIGKRSDGSEICYIPTRRGGNKPKTVVPVVTPPPVCTPVTTCNNVETCSDVTTCAEVVCTTEEVCSERTCREYENVCKHYENVCTKYDNHHHCVKTERQCTQTESQCKHWNEPHCHDVTTCADPVCTTDNVCTTKEVCVTTGCNTPA